VADQRLRDLERDAAGHGDPQAQARLLLERVRTGDLTEERLLLAAYCGHEASLCVARDLRAAVPVETELNEWVRGLRRWDLHASIRCVLVTMRALWLVAPPSDQHHVASAISILEHRLARPDHEVGVRALELMRSLPHPGTNAVITATSVGLGTATNLEPAELENCSIWAAWCFEAALDLVPAEVLVASVRADLAEWALAPST
jgi:hypothetical protein